MTILLLSLVLPQGVRCSLTVLVDAHVLLLGQDGVVGLEAVLVQHGLIAEVCQSKFVSSCIG